MELFSAKTATLDELKAMRRELLESPLKTSDDKVFRFARDDREMMERMASRLLRTGGVTDWRQYNRPGEDITVDSSKLTGYYQELLILLEDRGAAIDAEYMTLKTKDELLASDLVKWKKQIENDWWT